MNKIVILFDRSAKREAELADCLEKAFVEAGFAVQVDRHLKISVDWARTVEEKIRRTDAVLAVFSTNSLEREMLSYELEIAADARLKNQQMRFVCIPFGADSAALGTAGPLIGGYQTCAWERDRDTAPLIAEILAHLKSPTAVTASNVLLDPAGGGISSDSPFYVRREVDEDLLAFIQRGEPTVLIKGARQSGKTSLIAQGIKLCRENGMCALVTDFQRLGANLYADENELDQTVAAHLARQMSSQYGIDWDWTWEEGYSPTSNLDDFVRSLVGAHDKRVVWFMDEADWLFSTAFADSFFALVRSWHNARALSADVVWRRFSAVVAYATEAHLFIQDINQSPFNVGRRIELKGFTLRQTEELNHRYGEPLRGIDQVHELQGLLDGQPFLTRTAFDELVRSNGNLRALLASADRDDGPFGDHLRRVLVSVTQLSTVRDVIDRVMGNGFVESSPEVDRLVAAGILAKNSSGNHLVRCRLYRRYLERHLK